MTTETTNVSAPRPIPILGILGVIILAIWLIRYRGWQQILAWNPVVLWFVMLGLLSVALIIIGQIGTQQWLGALINSRFKMSLARLQIAMWTLLVLSAYI